MLRLCTRFGLVFVVVWVIAVTSALLLGNVMPTYAVNAVVDGSGGEDHPLSPLTLFDLNRNLRADYWLPMENVYNIISWFGNDKLIVTTQKGTFRDKDYERNLYLHNLHTGETATINEIASDTDLGGPNYFPMFSPTLEKMIYFEPYDQSLYLYDLNTRTKKPLWTVEDENAGYLFPNWSPDGKKIAFSPSSRPSEGENLLVIMNLESGETEEYSLPFADFSSEWSEDSQHILLSRYGHSANLPVFILRASDGQRLAFTEDLEAWWFDWGACEGKWLMYTRLESTQFAGYIVDTESGETLRLNDHPQMKTFDVGWIYPQDDCEHFLVVGYRSANSSGLGYAPLFLVNADLSSVQMIHQYAGVQQTKDNALVYETTTRRTKRTLYRQTLVPYSEPTQLAEYDEVDTWMQWAEDFSFSVYTIGDRRGVRNGGRLMVLDAKRNETRYLTDADERVSYFGLYRWED